MAAAALWWTRGLRGKSSASSTTTPIENGHVAAEIDGLANKFLGIYLRGENVDQIFARVTISVPGGVTPNPIVTWYATDIRNSVMATFEGSTVYRRVYDIFGKPDSSPWGDSSFGYTGREFDTFNNPQHNRARYYDAFSGRWISQDPMGFAAGDMNLYRYVNNSHPNATDPTGNFAIFGGVLGAGLGFLVSGFGSLMQGGGFWDGALKGAVIGGIAGATGGMALMGAQAAGLTASVGGSVAAGMMAGGFADYMGQTVALSLGWQKGGYNWGQFAGSVVTGGLLSGVGHRVFGGASAAANANAGQNFARQTIMHVGGGLGGVAIDGLAQLHEGAGYDWRRSALAFGAGVGGTAAGVGGYRFIQANRGSPGPKGALARLLGSGFPTFEPLSVTDDIPLMRVG